MVCYGDGGEPMGLDLEERRESDEMQLVSLPP